MVHEPPGGRSQYSYCGLRQVALVALSITGVPAGCGLPGIPVSVPPVHGCDDGATVNVRVAPVSNVAVEVASLVQTASW